MSQNLEPGTAIPDFQLPDENGDLHRLSDLQGDNLMVLHLSRGEHCPRERQFHRELLGFHEWCAVAYTELVSILPNSLHDVSRLKISTGAAWTFLSDGELELQRHFDINEYTDTHHDYAAVPHTLILSPGLVVEQVYVGYWFWGRPTSHQLWQDLGDVLSRTKADFDPTTPAARAAWDMPEPVALASPAAMG
jgi:peroxiredoxin